MPMPFGAQKSVLKKIFYCQDSQGVGTGLSFENGRCDDATIPLLEKQQLWIANDSLVSSLIS